MSGSPVGLSFEGCSTVIRDELLVTALARASINSKVADMVGVKGAR